MIDKAKAFANWEKHVDKTKPLTRAEMEQRVARFKALPASPRAFADTSIPAHQRTLMSVIGMGVTDNPQFKPAIPFAENFHIDYIAAERGKGAALHYHDSEEVFVAIEGRWTIYWGESGEEEITLDERDVISVPPFVLRGFKCASDKGLLLSVLGGKTPGRVKWASKVAEEAKRHGVGFDDAGTAVHFKD